MSFCTQGYQIALALTTKINQENETKRHKNVDNNKTMYRYTPSHTQT